MNEDIIRMAREAGIAVWHKDLKRWVVEPGFECFFRAAYAAGAAAEREARARVCDDLADISGRYAYAATAIRKRGEE